jgi:hypothetical protein
MYPLVALNFSMHREIAEMLESDAMRIIKNIQLRRQASPMSYREMLERSLNDMVDASESYSKASCYNRAAHCGRMAELIALQIHLLPSGAVVINLPDSAVCDFITNHGSCTEAVIVSEAYNNQRSWGSALLNNVIVKGDWAYFREFQGHVQLSSGHLEDVVNKFLQMKNRKDISEKAIQQMSSAVQRLLGYYNDLKFQLKMAMQLGLTDTSKLFQEENRAYIVDLQRNNL